MSKEELYLNVITNLILEYRLSLENVCKIFNVEADDIYAKLMNTENLIIKDALIFVLNNETVGLVDNIEEAEIAVNKIKEENKNKTIKLDLMVTTNYTENIEEITLESVQVAQAKVEQKVAALIKQEEKTKKPIVNGILLAVTPVEGRITSRFGHMSSRRSGAHTGTDIAATKGTK